MRIRIRQEPLPLVGVQLHCFLRAQPVPHAAGGQRGVPCARPTHGLISLMIGFWTTLYPACTNGHAVWYALRRADVHT